MVFCLYASPHRVFVYYSRHELLKLLRTPTDEENKYIKFLLHYVPIFESRDDIDDLISPK